METATDILKKPYLQLEVSKDFKKFMNLSGFKTLEQMLELPAHKLLEMKGFNMHKLFELYRFLKEHNLENRLETN
jgi:hypothetical protein